VRPDVRWTGCGTSARVWQTLLARYDLGGSPPGGRREAIAGRERPLWRYPSCSLSAIQAMPSAWARAGRHWSAPHGLPRLFRFAGLYVKDEG